MILRKLCNPAPTNASSIHWKPLMTQLWMNPAFQVPARFHLVNLDPVVYLVKPLNFLTLQYLPIPYNTYLFTCYLILPNSLPCKECLWDHQENFKFQYGSMKWYIWQWEKTMVPFFHNGEIRIKHCNIGLMIPLESFLVFCWFNFNFLEVFTLFLRRNCQKSLVCLHTMILTQLHR